MLPRLIASTFLLIAIPISQVHGQQATRILFSHYAPGASETRLAAVSMGFLGNPLEFGETAPRYEVVEGGAVQLELWEADQRIASTEVTLEDGDYSVFFHRMADGTPAISVARDALAAVEFPAPFDFETPAGNAAGRFLSLAALPVDRSATLVGKAQEFLVLSDGSRSPGGEFESRLNATGGPRVGGSFPATVNSRVNYTVEIEVTIGPEVLAQQFDLPAGTTDYVLIGDETSLQVIERPRPDARSLRVDGIYGEPGINGSGLQLYELPEIGRIFGFLFTYDETGSPTWYYLDSRCDPDRGFQCTTPGLLVAGGSFVVALYRADRGALAPGVDADLEIAGAARVRVPRADLTTPGFVGQGYSRPSANVILSLTPPTAENRLPFIGSVDAEFDFAPIRR